MYSALYRDGWRNPICSPLKFATPLPVGPSAFCHVFSSGKIRKFGSPVKYAFVGRIHSFYEAYFRDPFEFTGGTGRFEGASGHGMTNSFVDLFDDDGNFIPEHKTDHEWTGKLILRRNCK